MFSCINQSKIFLLNEQIASLNIGMKYQKTLDDLIWSVSSENNWSKRYIKYRNSTLISTSPNLEQNVHFG